MLESHAYGLTLVETTSHLCKPLTVANNPFCVWKGIKGSESSLKYILRAAAKV